MFPLSATFTLSSSVSSWGSMFRLSATFTSLFSSSLKVLSSFIINLLSVLQKSSLPAKKKIIAQIKKSAKSKTSICSYH